MQVRYQLRQRPVGDDVTTRVHTAFGLNFDGPGRSAPMDLGLGELRDPITRYGTADGTAGVACSMAPQPPSRRRRSASAL